jgi:membrane dipeptidase
MSSLAEIEEQIMRYEGRRRPDQRAVRLARSRAELDAALADGALALVHCLEGAHGLQGATAGKEAATTSPAAEEEILAHLEKLASRGVAYVTLAHFYPNQVAAPCFPFPESLLPLARWRKALQAHDLTRGLTPLGGRVVRRMLELGLLVDITHCTPAARAEVYAIVEALDRTECVLATHVGAQAINPSPYNLADWEIRWLADRGGVVGVIFMNYWLMPHETRLGLNFITHTLSHIVDVGGSQCAAIGTDLDGFTDPPDEIADAGELPRLTQRLAAERAKGGGRRFDDDLIRGLLGENALRLLRQGWGATR